MNVILQTSIITTTTTTTEQLNEMNVWRGLFKTQPRK
jgi:hypothetical protein